MKGSTITTVWREEEKILITKLAGTLTLEEVRAWKETLYRTSEQIPAESDFKMVIDLMGYEVSEQDLAVHKVQREVTPLFLAHHGFRVGFFDLFGVEPAVTRGESQARCVVVAHVHHDCEKMAAYNERLGKPTERFFCDRTEAEAWVRAA